MPLNFPHNPSTNDIYTAGGASYKWDGTVWKKALQSGVVDLLPSRVILMYSGTTAPSGFVMCDNSTAAQNANAPDLRGKFIIGAHPTGGSATYPGLSINSSGGSANAILPSHTHTQEGGGTDDDGGSRVPGGNSGGTLSNISNAGIDNTGTLKTDGSVTVTNANLPPYYALCYIMKI